MVCLGEEMSSYYNAQDFGCVIQIPRLGKDEIVLRAEELLDECWDGKFPIDVEAICDYLGIAIVPVEELREELEVEAYTAVDFKTIYVDSSRYLDGGARYRFSVAHELGHYILHREYFSSRTESLQAWRDSTSSYSYDYVEWQANYFAGSLLTPESALIKVLNMEFDGDFAKNCWGRSHGEFKNVLYNVRRFFRVSEEVIARRMRDTMPGAEKFEEIAAGLGRAR